eukprot:6186278-Pleurochrysis_carterae.AAC.1
MEPFIAGRAYNKIARAKVSRRAILLLGSTAQAVKFIFTLQRLLPVQVQKLSSAFDQTGGLHFIPANSEYGNYSLILDQENRLNGLSSCKNDLLYLQRRLGSVIASYPVLTRLARVVRRRAQARAAPLAPCAPSLPCAGWRAASWSAPPTPWPAKRANTSREARAGSLAGVTRFSRNHSRRRRYYLSYSLTLLFGCAADAGMWTDRSNELVRIQNDSLPPPEQSSTVTN